MQREGSESGVGKLSLDRRLRMLSNGVRRRLLVVLLEESSVDEPTAVEAITAGRDDPESVVVQLYHVHLPMLATEGLVEWHREEGRIHRGPDYESVRPLLEWLLTNDESVDSPSV